MTRNTAYRFPTDPDAISALWAETGRTPAADTVAPGTPEFDGVVEDVRAVLTLAADDAGLSLWAEGAYRPDPDGLGTLVGLRLVLPVRPAGGGKHEPRLLCTLLDTDALTVDSSLTGHRAEIAAFAAAAEAANRLLAEFGPTARTYAHV